MVQKRRTQTENLTTCCSINAYINTNPIPDPSPQVGADLVFPLSLEFMESWGNVVGGVASVNPTGKLAIVDLASEECLLYPGDGAWSPHDGCR